MDQLLSNIIATTTAPETAPVTRGMDHPLNWLTVAFFALTAVVCGYTCWLSYIKRRDVSGVREPITWFMMTSMFVLFVLIKIEKGVMLAGNLARSEMMRDGSYEERRPLQVVMVVLASVLWLCQVIYLGRHVRHRWERYKLPLLGSGAIIAFGVIRAVSLHEMDSFGRGLTYAKIAVESLASVAVIWGAAVRIHKLWQPLPTSRRFKPNGVEARQASARDDLLLKGKSSSDD